jgi:hypothetical protein
MNFFEIVCIKSKRAAAVFTYKYFVKTYIAFSEFRAILIDYHRSLICKRNCCTFDEFIVPKIGVVFI